MSKDDGAGGGLPPRDFGESDKSYLKRVAHLLPLPATLPERHEDYFEVSDGSIVHINLLRASKTEEEVLLSSERAIKFLAAARSGIVSRRKPLTVRKNEDGSITVLDGNSTLAAARKLGWQSLPVTLTSELTGVDVSSFGA